MTRRLVRDQREAELFRLSEPPAPAKAPPRSRRQSKDKPAPAPVPEMAEEVAARLTPVELDDLVRALPDEKLARVAVAATRSLRRRRARVGSQRRSRVEPSSQSKHVHANGLTAICEGETLAMLSRHISLAYDRSDGATTRVAHRSHSQAGTERFRKGAQLARDKEAGAGRKSIVVVLTPR